MISRPDGSAPRRAFLGAALLALASCAGPGPRDEPDPAPGSQVFAALIDDARGAMAQGDLARAGRLLDEAGEVEPDNPALFVEAARLRFRRGEQIAALEAADRALRLDPGHGPALLMRAQLVRDAHGFASARSWYEAALAADPENDEIRVDHAATLGDAGEYAAMLDLLRPVEDMSVHGGRAHFLRAVLAARAGKHVLARSLLARSGLVEEGVPAARLLDALIHMAQDNPDSAAAVLDELAKGQPGNVRLADLHARALFSGMRDRELVERHGARAARSDASPYLAMLVARSLERLGERGRAAPYLARAMAGPAGDPMPLASGSFLPRPTADLRRLVDGGARAQAAQEARKVRARFPLSSDMSALAGDGLLASGDAEGALAYYRDAAMVRRRWPLVKKAVHAYRSIGEEEAARTLLARHVAGEPLNAEALFMLAEASAERDDWLRAALLLDRAIALGAGSDPALLRLRAQAARALGREAEVSHFAGSAQLVAGRGFTAR